MPLRPDSPFGMSPTRRNMVPPGLSRLGSLVPGEYAEGGDVAATVISSTGSPMGTVEATEGESGAQHIVPGAPEERMPLVTSPQQSTRVVVYGRSGCPTCLAAIQDLIDRQVSFMYYDASRDAAAASQVQTILGSTTLTLPVIVQIGFGGT
ncbi:MAG: glutaredoxin domain-containing protein [Mycobacterium leprae]